MERLDADDVDSFLDRFRGCHDAKYESFSLLAPSPHSRNFSVDIVLICRDYVDGAVKRLRFRIGEVDEFQVRYNTRVDYPNVRDDIAIKTFDGKVFFDLGFAAIEPESPDDIRQSDIYFVGMNVSWEMEEYLPESS